MSANKRTTINTTKNITNIAELLQIADLQMQQTQTRTPNTCRLYESGRINIAPNSDIVADTKMSAKIADNTIILYTDADAKRKTNAKTNSADVLYNLVSVIRKSQAYKDAVANSKVAGCKEFLDYTITKQTYKDADYYMIDLQEHAPKQNADANKK